MAPNFTRNKSIVTRMHKIIEKTDPIGMNNVLKAIAFRQHRLEVLSNLVVPCIAIFGSDDQIAPKGVDIEIEQTCPRVKVIRLPGVGHTPMLEVPLALGALFLTL